MLSYISKTTTSIKSTFDLPSILDYWIPGLQKTENIAELKRTQKQEQVKSLQLQVPQDIEDAILRAESAQVIVAGYLERQWTAQQVMHIFCKLAILTDKVHGCLGEVMFEEAMIRAQLLDQYFDQTGNLIGPLHGLPIAFSDEASISGIDSSLGCLCSALKPQLKDAVLVQLIRNSGAIPFCKTNVPWHLLFNEASNPIFGKSKSSKHNISLGGRTGTLALLASTHLSMVGFGTDQAGGLRNPASHAGVFTLKPTSQRISSLTNVSLYDSIPSTPGPMSSSIDTLTFIYQALLTKDIQSQDPSLFPIPFNTQLYGETLRSKKLTVGIYVDDQIVRACPSARRAVFLAATALHSKGHNVVRFHPPSTDKALLLLSKLFAYEKLNLPCMKAGFTQQTTTLSNIFPMYTFAKIPKTFKTILFFLFGIGMKDNILKNLSYSYGGESGKNARSLEEYNSLIEEKEEYRRLFTSAWQNPEMDCLICPINACPPNMPCTSTPFTLSGSFYSSLYNLLDYPSGYVPHVTRVQPDDQITNIVQYAHNDRYIPRSDREFKFLSVMALEEVNNCIQDETILGSDIGVQVVGKPFEEEKVLAVMKMLSQSLSD